MYIGTTNSDKVAELAALLAPLGIPIHPVSMDVPEPWDTLRANAATKALAYAAHAGGVALSEDSGLFVAALGDLPGPWSARFYALDLATLRLGREMHDADRVVVDRANTERLLYELRDVPDERRAAEFRVALCVATPDGRVLFETEARYGGWIARERRGTHGFGYDPVFVGSTTFGKTFAEIDGARKNLRSHRRLALDALYAWAARHVTDGHAL